MPASRGPSKETPPRSPRTAGSLSPASSRRRAPSVPLAHVAKNFMAGASGAGAAGGGRGGAGEDTQADGALGLALGDVHQLVGAGHQLVHVPRRRDEDRGPDGEADVPPAVALGGREE